MGLGVASILLPGCSDDEPAGQIATSSVAPTAASGPTSASVAGTTNVTAAPTAAASSTAGPTGPSDPDTTTGAPTTVPAGTTTTPAGTGSTPGNPTAQLAVTFAGGGGGAWAPIGWWDGTGWVDPEDFPSAPESPIESVVAVGPGLTDGPLTGLTLGDPGEYCSGPELGRYIDLGRTLPDADLYRGYGALAVTAEWNVQPRRVVQAGADALVYQQVGESFVADRPDVDPTLGDVTEVYRSDLNGDGIEEVVFGFEHLADTNGVGAAGDFSLVIARLPHADGTVADQVLFEHYGDDPVTFPNPGRGSVLAIADLNGDGAMEVTVRSTFWEASVAEAFELQGDRLVRVMSGGCGV